MSSPINQEGLSLEQAPPLSIPGSFFALAPVALVAAGLAMVGWRHPLVASSWMPQTIAVTHLLTLGFLGMVMAGALLQMVPVVASSPVPGARFGRWIAGSMALGTAGLVLGIGKGVQAGAMLAIWLLGPAVTALVVAVGLGLKRGAKDYTTTGMKLAVGALLSLAVLGLWMAHGYAGMALPAERTAFIAAHAGVALMGWVAGLLLSVSWQVIPMFYMAEAPGERLKGFMLAGIGLAAFGPLGVIAWLNWVGPLDELWMVRPLAPGLVGAWLVHPIVTLRSLKRRKRKRKDHTVQFWQSGLACGLLGIPLLMATWQAPFSRWPMVLGWVALWGWAGLIVHGMLYRIVPFLVWFHRMSPWVGRVKVPSARKLMPDKRVRVAWLAHLGSLGLGVAAFASGSSVVMALAGVGLAGVGGLMGWNIVSVLRVMGPSEETGGAS